MLSKESVSFLSDLAARGVCVFDDGVAESLHADLASEGFIETRPAPGSMSVVALTDAGREFIKNLPPRI